MTYSTSPAAAVATNVACTRASVVVLLLVGAVCVGYVQRWDSVMLSVSKADSSMDWVGVDFAKELEPGLPESSKQHVTEKFLADDDDGGYGYAKGSMLTPEELGFTHPLLDLANGNNDQPIPAYENLDHIFAEPDDPDSFTGRASNGVKPWPQPRHGVKQSHAHHIRFNDPPFHDMHEYWIGKDKPQQIVGEWITGHLGNPEVDPLSAAAHQGVYVPVVDGKPTPMKFFSKEEAHDCINGKKIFFAGDSYQIQFFIGMAEVLLGDITNTRLNANTRRPKAKEVAMKLAQIPELAGVRLGCIGYDQARDECYGITNMKKGKMSMKPAPDKNSLASCNECLNRMAHDADAIVVGSTIHTLVSRGSADGHHGKEPSTKTVNDIEWLRQQWGHKLIWTTGPGIDGRKVTNSQKDELTASTLEGNMEVFHRTCGDLSNSKLPCLDMRHLTEQCRWSNCSADGGHRARYVNRMKAQYLLNMICEKTSDSDFDTGIHRRMAKHQLTTIPDQYMPGTQQYMEMHPKQN